MLGYLSCSAFSISRSMNSGSFCRGMTSSIMASCVGLGKRSSRTFFISTSASHPCASSRFIDPPSQQPAERAEVEVEVVVVEPEDLLELLHAGLQRHQGAAEALHGLVVEAAGLHAAQRLALHQLPQQLHDGEHQCGQAALYG